MRQGILIRFFNPNIGIKCSLSASTIANATKPENWSTAKPFESVPGPRGLPLIGNSHHLALQPDFVKLGKHFHRKYGDVVALRKILNFGDFLFLFNVKDIEWMLRNEGPTPVRDIMPTNKYYRHELRHDVFGDTYGLLNGQYENWATFRTTVNPIMMQPRVTQQYIPVVNQIADEFLVEMHRFKELHEYGEMPANFIEELLKYSFEAISRIALDIRMGTLGVNQSEKSRKAMGYIIDLIPLILRLDFTPFGAIHKKFNTRTMREYVEKQDFFTNLVFDLIKDVEARNANDPIYRNKPEHEKSVFEKLVAKDRKIAMVMTLDLLAAAVEAVGKTCGACLYYLAKNKGAQEKLRKELVDLLPHKDTPITKELIESAKYLKAVIKETMRLAPIAHSTVRRTTKDIVLGGYQIPPGVMIMMPHIYLSTGTDEHFRNPTAFDPDRYVRGNQQQVSVNPFTSLPFGFGPRSCIGKRMAQMEMEILVMKIVRNFYLDWTYNDMRFKQTLVYGLVDPLKIRLTDVSK